MPAQQRHQHHQHHQELLRPVSRGISAVADTGTTIAVSAAEASLGKGYGLSARVKMSASPTSPRARVGIPDVKAAGTLPTTSSSSSTTATDLSIIAKGDIATSQLSPHATQGKKDVQHGLTAGLRTMKSLSA